MPQPQKSDVDKSSTGAAVGQDQPDPTASDNFEEIEEVDTSCDAPYWVTGSEVSFAGYLPSEDEGESACVVCNYLHKRHCPKHCMQISQPIAQLEAKEKASPQTGCAYASTPSTNTGSPQKRQRLASQPREDKAGLDVKTIVRGPVYHNQDATTIVHQQEELLSATLDGETTTFESDRLSPSEPRRPNRVKLHAEILTCAERAGMLIAPAERELARQLQVLPPSPPITPSKHVAIGAADGKHELGDSHTLSARIRRDKETRALLQELRQEERSQSRSSSGASIAGRRPCAECQEDRNVAIVTNDNVTSMLAYGNALMLTNDDVPCLHQLFTVTKPTKRIKRSNYKIQKPEQEKGPPTTPVQSLKKLRKLDKSHYKPVEIWCCCGMPDNGKMMYRCCNDECFVGWYHGQCLNHTKQGGKMPWRKPDWICGMCTYEAREEEAEKLDFTREEVLEVFTFKFGSGYARIVSCDFYELSMGV